MIAKFLLALLFLHPPVLAECASLGQETLSAPSDGGILHRVAADAGSHDLARLLDLTEEYDLDVWQVAPSHVDIYTPPSAPALPPAFAAFNVSPSRLPAPVSHQPARPQAAWNLSSLANATYHGAYHPLHEIDEFIHAIAGLHPDLVRVVRLGHSGEGREMLGVSIARSDGAGAGRPKRGFVVNGAQHAREWVATAAALYLAHALVSNASEPHSLSHLLDSFDFHIVPTPNPDGYAYTWESDRFWYKNRMVLGPSAACVGLDMNRNWGFKWKPTVPTAFSRVTAPARGAVARRGADACSHWYPGQRAFQAPEVNNLANFVATLPNLQAFLDLRSYGQMLSSPFSYSCARVPKDAEDQLEAALGAARALRAAHGTAFTTGRLCGMLYRAPGNVVDWMYARAGAKYAYAAHLRDTGTFGFALPPGWIRPVGEETARMVEYLAQFIVKNGK